MFLFCPHCDVEIEILGEPEPRPLPECEACGGVLEVSDPDDDPEGRIDITAAGTAFLEAMRDHPAEARRLTADFDQLFPIETSERERAR